MKIELDVPPELEAELSAEAAEMGLALPEYAVRILASGPRPRPAPRTGSELVEYWQREGLIGSRPDIADSEAYARSLRKAAETRERP